MGEEESEIAALLAARWASGRQLRRRRGAARVREGGRVTKEPPKRTTRGMRSSTKICNASIFSLLSGHSKCCAYCSNKP